MDQLTADLLPQAATSIVQGEHLDFSGPVRELILKIQKVLPLAELCLNKQKRISAYVCLHNVISGRCKVSRAQECGCSFFAAMTRVATEGVEVFATRPPVNSRFKLKSESGHWQDLSDTSPKSADDSNSAATWELVIWKQDPARTGAGQLEPPRQRIIDSGVEVIHTPLPEPDEDKPSAALTAPVPEEETAQDDPSKKLVAVVTAGLATKLAAKGFITVADVLQVGVQGLLNKGFAPMLVFHLRGQLRRRNFDLIDNRPPGNKLPKAVPRVVPREITGDTKLKQIIPHFAHLFEKHGIVTVQQVCGLTWVYLRERGIKGQYIRSLREILQMSKLPDSFIISGLDRPASAKERRSDTAALGQTAW